jgi:glycosyltransferase involved in cell wall biosynthesis
MVENFRSHKNHPDVVHRTYYSKKTLSTKIPQVITLHDMIHEDFPQFFKRSIIEQKKLAIKNADAVICISHYTRERLLHWIDVEPSKVHVVHHGVSRPTANPTFIRPTGGFPYILYIGSRDGYKNFSVLARAFALCSREEPALRLLTVGGGLMSATQLSEFEELGIGSKVVHLPGEKNLRPLIQKAQCVVSTSLAEGFGLVPLETLNEGIPCVVSDIAVNREIWDKSLPMFQPDNEVELAQTLLMLLRSDKYWQSVATSGNSVASSFDLVTMASKTFNVYNRIAR